MTITDIDTLVAIAESVVDVAGAAIRPLFRAGIGADLKGDASPVTIADRSAELAMRGVLSQRTPGFGLLGEEFPDVNPDARYRWVMDPIDGTRAFMTGRPVFGTLLALLDGDRPIIGIIDQCVTGERWVGVAGQPTRFRSPFGGTAGCRPCASLDQAELSITSTDVLPPADLVAWQRLNQAARRTTYGGDCYAYGLVALGQVDIVAESTLKLWDWAALIPVIEGAGGRVTDWQGRALTSDSAGDVLAVGDARILHAAVALLNA